MIWFVILIVLLWRIVWRFAVRFPLFSAMVAIVVIVYNIMDAFPASQAVLSRMGARTSGDITGSVISTNWFKADNCGEMKCDDHRYVTLAVTNHTGEYYKSFTLSCSTSNGNIELVDGSGIAAHAQRQGRSYRIDDGISSVEKCWRERAQVGKPLMSNSTNWADNRWGDRTNDIMLPEDTE